jgi:hypothetical protein
MYTVYYLGSLVAKAGSYHTARMAVNTHKKAFKTVEGYTITHPDGTQTQH